jgi:hypothetical protein
MNELEAPARATALTSTLHLELDALPWHRYSKLVFERGLEHVAADAWPTDRMALEGLHEHAPTTLRDRSEHVVEFAAFTADEAAAWLERHSSDAGSGQRTLASLYAHAAGIEPETKHPLGFTA